MSTLTVNELDGLGVAELIFAANIDPATLGDAEAWDCIDHQLTVCGCDLNACAEARWTEESEHPEVAIPRWGKCMLRALRLLAVEA
jgi:hypothetical protein